MNIEEFKTMLENSNNKINILGNTSIWKHVQFSNDEIVSIINEILNDEEKKQLIFKKIFGSRMLAEILASLEDENEKIRLMYYKNRFSQKEKVKILCSLSDENKINILLKTPSDWYKDEEYILSTLSIDSLFKFLNEHKSFLSERNIKTCYIIDCLPKAKQLEFVLQMEQIDLTLTEKRSILALLSPKIKETLSTYNMPPEYVKALNMQTDNIYDIKIDWNGNLEQYRGFDDIINIYPLELNSEQKEKLFQLASICPNLTIRDNFGKPSTFDEYMEGEKWIQVVIDGIDANWTDIQKLAFISKAICNQISYAPSHETDVENRDNERALWKGIVSGYSICSGIANIGEYVIKKFNEHPEKKINFNAKYIGSEGQHAFLLIQNIDLPQEDGTVVRGNTIIDNTWDLVAMRYGFMPNYFCVSYEKARKKDIKDGWDGRFHKNDEELAQATLDLNEQSLRNIFQSIGLTDKKGNFPIQQLLKNIKNIEITNLPVEEQIRKELQFFVEYCPEFAFCQHETMGALNLAIKKGYMNFKYNDCVINQVYEKNDNTKSPIVYMYVDLPNVGKKFYYADKNVAQFVELSQTEFEEKFECYDTELRRNNCIRPWEKATQPKKTSTIEQKTDMENIRY